MGQRVSKLEALRTVLFVPGSRPERVDKAIASGADLVCIDLEDSVPEEGKDAARQFAIARAAAEDASIAIRINGLVTEHGLRDLLALRESSAVPAALFLPMVDSPGHIAIARGVLDQATPPLVPLVEAAAALRVAHDIAASPAVAAMMFGGGDLSAELGVALAWEPLLAARGQFVLAAAGRGIGLIDVPFVSLDDSEGLAEECGKAKALGFTAKAAIHPSQIPAIQNAFSPSPEEINEARAALAAFRSAGGKPIRHNGRMLEIPLVRRYEALLAAEEGKGNA